MRLQLLVVDISDKDTAVLSKLISLVKWIVFGIITAAALAVWIYSITVSPRSTYWPIRDPEAFEERLAILLEDGEQDLTAAHRLANDHANRTRYSLVATAALQDDWTGLWAWCAELCCQQGDEVARAIQVEIQDVVTRQRKWLKALGG